ncbi:helix-turn-helix domain-containing protein [Oerskovia sp. NPDC060338]|uniref:helix-turn-helix domain-containing protein n=1 Tax=Oerskovia sp. NPDC060338 TaxID=3347100 RepID=UPI00365A6FFC
MPHPASPAATIAARVTPVEAALLTDRHPDTVYAALATGELHGAQRTKGGRWKIRVACLEAWADGAKCEHQASASNVVELDTRRPVSA